MFSAASETEITFGDQNANTVEPSFISPVRCHIIVDIECMPFLFDYYSAEMSELLLSMFCGALKKASVVRPIVNRQQRF